MTADAIVDMALLPNKVTAIAVSDDKGAKAFTADSTKPELSSFDLDLTLEVLVLRFTETVKVSEFKAAGVTLQSQAGAVATELRVLDVATASGADSYEVTVSLKAGELNDIKKNRKLCTSNADCTISVTELTIKDMNNNALVAIGTGSAKP
eukprot:UC1_evm1s1220